MPLGESALHDIHLARGARMETRDGWQVPAHYGSVATELQAAQSAVAVGERCALGIWEVAGVGVPELANRLGAGDVPVGAAAPVALGNAGEARWCRLTRELASLAVPGAWRLAPGAALTDALRLTPDTCLHVTEVSSGLTTLLVVGPNSPDLLARMVRVDLDPRVFADRRLALTAAVGVPVQVLRWDRLGSVLAYELTVGRDVAEYFTDALAHAGSDLGLQFIGADAQEQLQAPGARRQVGSRPSG